MAGNRSALLAGNIFEEQVVYLLGFAVIGGAMVVSRDS
jgi:hypothetical protein